MESQETKIRRILEQAKIIAIVGLSPDPDKASNRVASYLMDRGYKIIPINPNYDEILGQKAYRSLSEIPGRVDVVDIFMRADRIVPVVEEAVKLKPGAIWLQLGIINDEARKIAEGEGISFVMDSCMKQQHEKMTVP